MEEAKEEERGKKYPLFQLLEIRSSSSSSPPTDNQLLDLVWLSLNYFDTRMIISICGGRQA